MKFTLQTEYIKATPVVCDWKSYTNGVVALRLLNAETGEPMCVASVNPPGHVSDGEIAVKNWSENEGMDAALQSAGIIEEKPLRHIDSGFVTIPVYALTDAAITDIAATRMA